MLYRQSNWKIGDCKESLVDSQSSLRKRLVQEIVFAVKLQLLFSDFFKKENNSNLWTKGVSSEALIARKFELFTDFASFSWLLI